MEGVGDEATGAADAHHSLEADLAGQVASGGKEMMITRGQLRKSEGSLALKIGANHRNTE